MTQSIYYDFKFTTLNEYIDAERTNKYIASKIKKTETNYVALYSKNKLKPFKSRVIIKFIWFEKKKNRDPDNIAFAKKFILDGLVKAGILENDGHKQIEGFSHSYEFKDSYGVRVVFNAV